MKVTVAVAGDPRTALVLGSGEINGISHDELRWPYEDRPKVELDVDESDTLRAVLERAIAYWEVQASPRTPIDSIGRIDFYDPGRPLRLHTELPVLDADGRVRWVGDWQRLTYRELLAAGDAKVLPGDPRRPYLLLDPGGYGNGLFVDWQTLVTVWEEFWDLLDYIAAIGGAFAAWELFTRLWRAKDAPVAVRGHYREWQARGARPDNVDELLGRRPWHADDFAARFGCTGPEAEAFLLGAGYSQGQDGLWRRGGDEAARLLHGNFELAIHVAMTRERSGVEQILRERVGLFLSTGKAPRLDWQRVREVPRDQVGFRDPREVARARGEGPPGRATTPRQGPVRRVLLYLGDHLVQAVMAVLVAAGLAGLVFVLRGDAPSIGEQVAEVRREAIQSGRRIAYHRRVQLRPGVDSEVFVLAASGVDESSWQLRIYDELDDKLALRLHFTPRANEASRGFGYPLEDASVMDVDRDGHSEVVAPFVIQDKANKPAVIPLVVYWSDEKQRYDLAALLRDAPEVADADRRRRPPPPVEPSDLSVFFEPVVLADRAAGRVVRSYVASSIDLTAGRVLAAYDLGPITDPPEITRLHLQAWTIVSAGGRPELHRVCLVTSSDYAVEQIVRHTRPRLRYTSFLRRLLRTRELRLDGPIDPGGGCVRSAH